MFFGKISWEWTTSNTWCRQLNCDKHGLTFSWRAPARHSNDCFPVVSVEYTLWLFIVFFGGVLTEPTPEKHNLRVSYSCSFKSSFLLMHLPVSATIVFSWDPTLGGPVGLVFDQSRSAIMEIEWGNFQTSSHARRAWEYDWKFHVLPTLGYFRTYILSINPQKTLDPSLLLLHSWPFFSLPNTWGLKMSNA